MMNHLHTVELPVAGNAKVGTWIEREVRVSAFPRGAFIPFVPDPQFSAFRHYALSVRDGSMNQIVQKGEFVVCAVVGPNWKWNEGDVVVVERRRDGGNLLETTLKQIHCTDNDDGIYLCPRSDDPRFQEPIRLGDELAFVVDIVALVVAKHVLVPIVGATAKAPGEPHRYVAGRRVAF